MHERLEPGLPVEVAHGVIDGKPEQHLPRLVRVAVLPIPRGDDEVLAGVHRAVEVLDQDRRGPQGCRQADDAGLVRTSSAAALSTISRAQRVRSPDCLGS